MSRISNEKAIEAYKYTAYRMGTKENLYPQTIQEICKKCGVKEDFVRETAKMIMLVRAKKWPELIEWIKRTKRSRMALEWADEEVEKLPEAAWLAQEQKEKEEKNKKADSEKEPIRNEIIEIPEVKEDKIIGSEEMSILSRIADSLEKIAESLGDIDAKYYTEIDVLRGINAKVGKLNRRAGHE